MARVVLDALAVADLGHHLQVEAGALFQPLRLDQLVLLVEVFQPVLQLDLDRLDRVEHALAGAGIVRARIDGVTLHLADRLAGERIEQRHLLHFAIEQLDAQRLGLRLGRKHVDDLAAHAIGAAAQLRFVAGVLQLGQLVDQLALVDALAGGQDQAQ